MGYLFKNETVRKIEEDFYNWEKGSELELIWHWFDDRVKDGIGNRYFN